MVRVVDIACVPERYELIVAFSGGERKRFAMGKLLDRGVFSRLKDRDLFASAHVAFDTVQWPGDIDIDPETLYEEGEALE